MKRKQGGLAVVRVCHFEYNLDNKNEQRLWKAATPQKKAWSTQSGSLHENPKRKGEQDYEKDFSSQLSEGFWYYGRSEEHTSELQSRE